jgi:hypothetical protein
MEPANAIPKGLLGLDRSKPAPNSNGKNRINSNNMPFCSIKNYKIQVLKLNARISVMEITIMKM